MASERRLTELEGAVLTEIEFRGNNTAYKVRRAFEASFSVQWRGSAGAVSPAVHRLEARGLLMSAAHPTRRGKTLTLTSAGQQALRDWAEDEVLASGAGMDPFRLRAGVWLELETARRQALFERLRAQLSTEIATLERRDYEDALDKVQSELAIDLLRSRLAWLESLAL